VWLTVPISHKFGATISGMAISRPDWSRAHRDTLRQAYAKADRFKEVWREIEPWLETAAGTLAEANSTLIERVARRLGLGARFERSSALGVAAGDASARLAGIVSLLAPGGTYLSGGGGAKYQDEAIFDGHGLKLAYSGFKPEPYARSGEPFIAGLSILDALFHLGFEATAALVRSRA
jgi:hypothetical protein